MSVKQRKTDLKWQSGRSMVEMIGVLSVIGVLTIGGITGIKYALQVHAENETVNDFNVAVAGAKTLGLEFADKGPVPVERIVSVPEQNMRGDYFVTNTISPVMVNVESNGYTVRIAGISKVVCEQIKYGKYGETCAMIGASYEDCGENALADIDCGQFDGVKDPEERSNRKSALQLDENFDINFVDAAHNYSSLILYFGSSGMNLDDSDEGGNGGGPLGPGDGDDPDTNLDNPLLNVDASKCILGTPFLEGQGDKQFEVCCTSAGGEWSTSGDVCCIGAKRNYTQKNGDEWVNESSGTIGNAFVEGTENAACCNFAASSLNENPSCCAEAGYEYLNGVCCEVEEGNRSGRDANGNPSSSCPSPSGVCNDVRCLDGRWPREVNGGCCCGAEDVSGNVNEACCGALAYQWTNGTCCKLDSNKQPTGEDYKGTTTSSCPPPPGGVCVEPCPDGSWPVEKNGVCCCGTVDNHGNASETCCKSGRGDWHETDGVSVCCENPCAWISSVNACCSNNIKCPDGKTLDYSQACLPGCPNGEQAIKTEKNGKKIVLCCEPDSPRGYDSSLPRPSGALPYEAACCTAARGLNMDGACCKQNSSIDLWDHKRKDICCRAAGGVWKNSLCCAKWSWQFVKEGGGMCHKPSSK